MKENSGYTSAKGFVNGLIAVSIIATLTTLVGCKASDKEVGSSQTDKPAATENNTDVASTVEEGALGIKVAKPASDDRSYLNLSSAKTLIGDQKKNKMNANYHFNQAESFREKNHLNEAIEEYKKAIRAYPNDGAFYKNLGGTFAMVGKLDDAEAVLTKGTEVSPDDWLIWNNLAVVLQNQKKNTECVAAIKKSISLNPPEYAVENMNLTLKQLEKSVN